MLPGTGEVAYRLVLLGRYDNLGQFACTLEACEHYRVPLVVLYPDAGFSLGMREGAMTLQERAFLCEMAVYLVAAGARLVDEAGVLFLFLTKKPD